jgi:hypothetical protein
MGLQLAAAAASVGSSLMMLYILQQEGQTVESRLAAFGFIWLRLNIT